MAPYYVHSLLLQSSYIHITIPHGAIKLNVQPLKITVTI